MRFVLQDKVLFDDGEKALVAAKVSAWCHHGIFEAVQADGAFTVQRWLYVN
jgi:hypothetical protein